MNQGLNVGWNVNSLELASPGDSLPSHLTSGTGHTCDTWDFICPCGYHLSTMPISFSVSFRPYLSSNCSTPSNGSPSSFKFPFKLKLPPEVTAHFPSIFGKPDNKKKTESTDHTDFLQELKECVRYHAIHGKVKRRSKQSIKSSIRWVKWFTGNYPFISGHLYFRSHLSF